MIENISSSQQELYHRVASDSRVPMALRIGIIGHRSLTVEEVVYARGEVVQLIDSMASELSNFIGPSRESDTYNLSLLRRIAHSLYDVSSSARPVIRLTTSLATGGDRVALDHQLGDLGQFIVLEKAAILPFSSVEYRRDFSSSESSTHDLLSEAEEFDGFIDEISRSAVDRMIELNGDYSSVDTRDDAYHHCAEVLVEHCDLIVAIYDEERDQHCLNGHQAGTAATIKLALDAQRPVIKIHPTAKHQPRLLQADRLGMIARDDVARGKTLSETLARTLLFTDVFHDGSDSMDRCVNERVDKILRQSSLWFANSDQLICNSTPPNYNNDGPISYPTKAIDRLRYLNTYAWFKRLFRRDERLKEVRNALSIGNKMDVIDTANIDAILSKPNVVDDYYSRYLLADSVAVRYASIHRSTYLLIYLLAALALASASVGVIFKSSMLVLTLAVSTKTFALLGIYLLYKSDRRNHHTWLQSRCLAEVIRPNVYLTLFGRSFSFLDKRRTAEFRYREVLGHGKAGVEWVYMYSETISRYIGFGRCPMSQTEHREGAIDFLRKYWLASQTAYHSNNASELTQLGESLSDWTARMFYLTAVFLVIKIILVALYGVDGVAVSSQWYYPSKFVTLGTMIFPIVASAIFAIRNHAEFDISAQRSMTLRAFFCSLSELFRFQRQQNKASKDDVNHSIEKGIQILSDMSAREVSDWLEIYEVKESELG